MTDASTIGVGVVGLGMISRPHLEGYKAADGARLVAVCDIDPARAQAEAERYGARPTRTSASCWPTRRSTPSPCSCPISCTIDSPSRRSRPAST